MNKKTYKNNGINITIANRQKTLSNYKKIIDDYCKILKKETDKDYYEDIEDILIFLSSNNTQYYTRNWIIYYFEDKVHTKNINNKSEEHHTYTIYKVSTEEFLREFKIPYIESKEVKRVFRKVCGAIRYSNTRKKDGIPKIKDDNIILSDLIMEYILACDLNKISFPYHVPSFLTPEPYFTYNSSLFLDQPNLTYVCYSSIKQLFKENDIIIPEKTAPINKLLNHIEKICEKRKPLTSDYKNEIIYVDIMDLSSLYIYRYKYDKKELIKIFLPMNPYNRLIFTKTFMTVTFNSRIKPILLPQLKDYLSELTMNDLASLRTLAMLAASASQNLRPLKKITIFENKKYAINNLENFFYFLEISTIHFEKNGLYRKKKIYEKYIKAEPIPSFHKHVIIGEFENINKCNYESRITFEKMINGSTLSLYDYYKNNLHFRNYSPILCGVQSFNSIDYNFLKNNYNPMELIINPNILYHPYVNMLTHEWLKRVFIPWGMDMLSNKKLDITKNITSYNDIPTSDPIQKFISICIKKEQGNHIYPESLYRAYLEFLKIFGPNTQPLTKRAFIKQIRKNSNIDYRQYHIRKTSLHEGSNKYAFHNIAINTEALQEYTTNDIILEENKKNAIFRQTLDIITDEYIHLFDDYIQYPY